MRVGHVPVAQPSPPQRVGVSGRLVGVVALLAVLGAVLAVTALFAWPTGSKVQPPHGGWVTVGDEEDFALWEPEVRVVNGPRGVKYGIHIVRLPEETLALWNRSPYRGCLVPWRPDFEFQLLMGWFRDPCHSATFDITGHLVFGPSPRGMDRFAVRIEDGQVQVDTHKVIEGPPQDPQHVWVTPPREPLGRSE